MSLFFSSLRPLFLVLLLWLVGLGAAAQFAKIAVVFPQIRALYPTAGAEIGLLLSVISFFGILFGLSAGILAAKLGYRNLLLFALLLGAMMSFWQATLPTFWVMLFTRLLEGVSHLIIVVVAPTLIGQITPLRYRGQAMTLWSTFFGVSFAVVAWIGIPYSKANGLGSLFFVHGLFMVGMVMIFAISFKSIDKTACSSEEDLSLRSVLQKHNTAYRSPFVSAPAMGWLFYTFTFVSLLTILPDLLPDNEKNSVAGLMPLASIVVSLVVVSALLPFMSPISIIQWGLILGGATLALFWTQIPMAYVSIGLFAVLGLVQGASFAAVPYLNSTVESQALANGAMAQMGNLGNTLGTPILLLVISVFGYSGFVVSVLACYLIGFLVHTWLARQRQQSEADVRSNT